MKKMCSLAFAFVLLFSLASIPAYAMDNDQVNAIQTTTTELTPNNNMNMNNYQSNDGVNNRYRTNNYQSNDGVNNDYRMNNITNDRYNTTANNYRTTATDNTRGNYWGWLGLLGLAGLLGRSRQRERSERS